MQQVRSIVRSNWVRCTGYRVVRARTCSGSANATIVYELHYHLGIAYTRLQHPNLAISHYQAAIQIAIYPKLKLELTILGQLGKATGDLGAKTAYEMALQINFAAGHYNLGMTLKALGCLKDATAAPASNPVESNLCTGVQNLGVVCLNLVMPESLAFGSAIALRAAEPR